MGSRVNKNRLTTTTKTTTTTTKMSSNKQWQEPATNQSDGPVDGGSQKCGGCGHGRGCHGRG